MQNKVLPKSILQMCYVEKGHSPEHNVTPRALTRLATVLLCAQAHTEPILP